MLSSCAYCGSPPPVRGKVQLPARRGRHPRITPACAGKSGRPPKIHHTVPDHPRLCGEKDFEAQYQKTTEGSPPPVRGKEVCGIVLQQLFRITPACAGKSRYTPLRLAPRRGSPPPVRGKGSAFRIYARLPGITPACAGKSSRFTRKIFTPSDHPRLCGEKIRQLKYISFAAGSPPPVRGKETLQDAYEIARRITPACAGKRSPHPTISCVDQDHPRVGGKRGGETMFRNINADHPRVCGEK